MSKFIRLGGTILNASNVSMLRLISYDNTHKIDVKFVDEKNFIAFLYENEQELRKDFENAWQILCAGGAGDDPGSNGKNFFVV